MSKEKKQIEIGDNLTLILFVALVVTMFTIIIIFA